MSYEITGVVINIGKTVEVTDSFRKRDFVIAKTVEFNGNTFTDEIKLQTVQKNCGLLDKVIIGDTVTVSFNVKGNKYKDNWFVNLDAWKVEIIEQSMGEVKQKQYEDDFPF